MPRKAPAEKIRVAETNLADQNRERVVTVLNSGEEFAIEEFPAADWAEKVKLQACFAGSRYRRVVVLRNASYIRG